MNTFRLELFPSTRVVVRKHKDLWIVVAQSRGTDPADGTWKDMTTLDEGHDSRITAMSHALSFGARILHRMKALDESGAANG